MGSLRKVFLAFLVLAGLSSVAPAQEVGPHFPDWSHDVRTWDAIGMLSPESKTRITGIQKNLQEKYKVGLWVVLLDSQERYGAKAMSIEGFAAELAGQRIRPLANKDFILLLVCKDDRKSRIELGENWNQEWNDGCDLITQEALVANFKRGQFDQGVVQAVEALAEMVTARVDPPAMSVVTKQFRRWGSQLSAYTYVPPEWIVPSACLGVLCLLGAIGIASARGPLAILGGVILLLVLFSKVLAGIGFFVIMAWNGLYGNTGGSSYRSRSSWGSSSSSSSYSSSSFSSFSSSSSSSGGGGWGSGGGSTGSW